MTIINIILIVSVVIFNIAIWASYYYRCKPFFNEKEIHDIYYDPTTHNLKFTTNDNRCYTFYGEKHEWYHHMKGGEKCNILYSRVLYKIWKKTI